MRSRWPRNPCCTHPAPLDEMEVPKSGPYGMMGPWGLLQQLYQQRGDLKSLEQKSGSYRFTPNSTNIWPGEPLVILSSCSPVLGSLDCDCLASSAAFSPPPPNKEHFPKHVTC